MQLPHTDIFMQFELHNKRRRQPPQPCAGELTRRTVDPPLVFFHYFSYRLAQLLKYQVTPRSYSLCHAAALCAAMFSLCY